MALNAITKGMTKTPASKLPHLSPGGIPASAKLPDQMERIDVLELQLSQTRFENASLLVQAAVRGRKEAEAELTRTRSKIAEKYKIGETGEVDLVTGKITRS